MAQAFFGKRALVTGGTGGIGRALAMALAEQGAEVTVTGRGAGKTEEKALKVISCAIGGAGGLSAEQAAAFILSHASNPDILVCSWGPFARAALSATDAGMWRFLTESNLIFPGIMISSVFCAMIKRGWGRILLFGGTGTAHIRAYRTTAAYSAAKTALGVLVKSAALEAKGTGVSCNLICPGLTDTEYCTDEELAYNRRHSPGGKTLKPDAIARRAMEILENPLINGEIIEAGAQGI